MVMILDASGLEILLRTALTAASEFSSKTRHKLNCECCCYMSFTYLCTRNFAVLVLDFPSCKNRKSSGWQIGILGSTGRHGHVQPN